MLRKIVILFICLLSNYFFAQTKCVGKIKDFNENPIFNASVVCKNTEGHIISFSFTDNSGDYSIDIETSGSFIIEVNKAGFLKEKKDLIVDKKNKKYQLDFVLNETSELLDDLVIEIENPIKQMGDTLSYDAKNFSTGREQTVEDLLKNIPGITVEKDGKIQFAGIEIEKVMVDGDDFFNKGYSLLTKNMPNKPLDKVQILRRYSNNKLLKGIEESNKVALNLTIDDKYKDIWFGDISMGYGLVSENRYDVSGNLMNFSKKYKNFLNYGLNNIGLDKVGSIEDMIFNNNDLESIGSKNLNKIMGLDASRAGQLKDERTRINNAENISLSTIIPLTEVLKVKFVGFLGLDENYAFNNRLNVTSVGNTYFENSEMNRFKSHLKKGYINLLTTYDISKNDMLQVSSVFNKGIINNYNDLTFNKKNTLERLETENSFFDQKLTYTHKWKDKNVVLIKGRFFSNKIPQFYAVDDYLLGDLFSFDADAMNNNIDNQKTFSGIEADFKLKQKNNDLIEFQVGYQYNKDIINTNFQLFNNYSSIRPNEFQTDSSFSTNDFYIRSRYTWKWTNFQITGRGDAHQLFNRFESLKSNKSQNPFYINPSISFRWDITPTQVLIAAYMLNYSNIPVINVNDTYVLSSSRSFSKGLGNFQLTDFQSANIRYTYNHYLSRYNITFGLDYSKQNNTLSTRSILNQNNNLSESILMKGGNTYSFSIKSQFYLPYFMKSTISFGGNYRISKSFNVINNSGLRKTIYYSQNYNFQWRTNYRTGFNFSMSSEFTFDKVESPDFINNFNNNFNVLELYYLLGKFNFKILGEHYHFGNLENNNKDHLFIDFETSYNINDKYTITLRGNNLLNKKNFSTYRISDIGYTTSTYSLVNRYILLSIKFRF
ncbi:TonB-dependent receptor (plasmid) [Flavobacterium sp. CBA20B-1]|uniref:TonB-dependent receptor n=1 Tax=unclassified Flavobacterium TaxID=196869 RepID=UPI0022240DFC|nr:MULTISPECIES: TonB-dependent receptor [unclassified Flavobacterium]WCM43596.1 TonB-dependent receptor [Flavobacterium sp. CBA20B-1]